jgi:hypothetical protein
MRYSLGVEFVLKDSVKKVKLSPFATGGDVLVALPEDLYISAILNCRVKGSRGAFLVTTAAEVIIYDNRDEVWRANLADLRVETRGVDWVVLNTSNDSVEVGPGMGYRKKVLEHFAKAQQSIAESEKLVASLPKFVPPTQEIMQPVPKVSSPKIQPTSTAENWPNSKIIGSKLTKKASDAISRQSQDDEPWFILVSFGGGGVLAAFDDRLTIIKTGALTSWAAGSLGGERAATFFFRDVTGLEYNSGFSNGVLEVLTASYNGTANKDYWRGSNKSRNADSNDPHTLSNTLPLAKHEYNNALDEIKELRRRIARSKEQVVLAPSAQQPPSTNTASLSDELMKLAELHKAGILSDDEFQSAKKRMLG